MTSIPAWVEKYLTVPYVPGGRTLDGADCFGLVRLVLEKEAGIPVPSYSRVDPGDVAARRAAREAESMGSVWQSTPGFQAQAFDVVPMTREHIGIMVSDRYVLHSESPAAGPCCETLAALKKRIREPLRRHFTRCT